MTATKRKQKPQARRALILDEAIRMLGEHGYNGLTVQALAERCDISNAGLLYYFRSKDHLLLAALDEFEQREREFMTPLVEGFEATRDNFTESWRAIVYLLQQMVARFTQKPDMARLLFVLQAEALDRTHPAHGWFRQREQLTLDLYESLLQKLVPEPATTSRHLVATIHGLGQHWLRQDMDFCLVEEWCNLSALILVPHAGETR